MKHLESSIATFVRKLNSEFWLPAIQRKFVWKESQICELFDSVMREYPIGSFLVWRTRSDIRKRKFIEIWETGDGTARLFLPADGKEKQLVLDGQQRIQSFFIGLQGRFGKKTLHFNIVSGDRSRVGSVIQKTLFEFEFMEKARDWNWVRIDQVLDSPLSSTKIAAKLLKDLPTNKGTESHELIHENIVQLIKVFKADPAITYQLLDGTDDGNRYDDNDVVEVFVRANSGGTKLEKSELLFALLSSNWDSAGQNLEYLESELAEKGFVFTRDYFLKACLILLEKKAQYDVKKFRDAETLKQLKDRWSAISDAITDVVDFLPQFTPIANSKALPSKNALLPLIAYRYFQPKGWKSVANQNRAAQYLLRTSIAGSYNGAKDDLLDALTEVFRSTEEIDLGKVFSTIQSKGRAITISREQFFSVKYLNNRIMLIMKLLRPDLDFVASNKNNLPTVDHLISRKLLKAAGVVKREKVDQIANLVALSADENQNSKRAKTISDWLLTDVSSADRENVCKRLYIPVDTALWTPDRFDDFIAARKALIEVVPQIKDLLGDPAGEDEDEL